MKTHIAVVLDRSGSMGTVRKDTINGFNEFLNGQKEAEGHTTMTLVQFDHEYFVQHRNKDVTEISELDNETYTPRGSTALLDAIGNTIYDTTDYIEGLDKSNKPDNVLFVILTDGHENASSGFDGETIKNLIDQKEEADKWDFVYLGANQDAIATSARFGIKGGKAMTYSSDAEGTSQVFESLNTSTQLYRCAVATEDGALLKGTNYDFFSSDERAKNSK